MWDGEKLVPLDSPDDDSINGLALSVDDRLVGGDAYASISTAAGGWDRIPTKVKWMFAFARFKDNVYALTARWGVMRVYPGTPAVVSPPLDALGLVSMGDGLIAIGEDGVLVFDGSAWTKVRIPVCEVGKQPC